MNKRINFEDTIFILNVRIRMIKDLLRLDIDTDLFHQQTIGDLEFVNSILEILAEKFLSNMKLLNYGTEADCLLDTEWQFSQILNEISGNSSSYSDTRSVEIRPWIDKFREDGRKRYKQIEESCSTVEQSITEPVVSQAELIGLLGNV